MRGLLALASFVAVAVGVGFAAVLASRGDAKLPAQRATLADPVTVTGTAVTQLTEAEIAVLNLMQRPGASVYEIGRIQDRVYFKITHPEQTTCYGAGPAAPTEANGRFGSLKCAEGFPSANEPLLDLATFRTSPGGETSVHRSEGIVADGIESVGFMTSSGDVVGVTPVNKNAFRLADPPPGEDVSLVAMNAEGNIVYSASPSEPD